MANCIHPYFKAVGGSQYIPSTVTIVGFVQFCFDYKMYAAMEEMLSYMKTIKLKANIKNKHTTHTKLKRHEYMLSATSNKISIRIIPGPNGDNALAIGNLGYVK